MSKITWKLEQWKLSDIKPYGNNPRRLTDKGMKDLEKSIKKFGLAEPLVINTDGAIIGGHGRYYTLQKQGIDIADCYVPSRTLNKKEFDELNVRLNKNIAGEWDFDILANEFELPDLLEWGFDKMELGIDDKKEIPEDADEVPEVKQDPIARRGDIFILDGKHRVMCGDSTNSSDVALLMDGKKADMVFTDPPYNIDYGNIKHPKFKVRDIQNDNMPESDFIKFVGLFTQNIKKYANGCVYVCGHPGRDGRNMFSVLDHNLVNSTVIIWKKDCFTLGRGKYQNQYEPIWFGWVTQGVNFCEQRNLSNVWEMKRPKKSGEHPTMKPIEIMTTAIGHASKVKDFIMDLFLGSGSTLIAAELTNRVCYGMELDEHYIDVILKRYHTQFPDKEIKCVNREYNFKDLYDNP